MEFKKSTTSRRPSPPSSSSASSLPTGSRPARRVPERPPLRPVKAHDSTITRPSPQPAEEPKKEPPALAGSYDAPAPTHVRQRRKVTFPAIIIGAACLLVLIAVIHEVTSPASSTSRATEAPNYQTILPKGASVDQFGGWKRISPPEKDPVFAYADSIDGVAISVSEQPLPESFRSGSDSQVAELAKKFNATTKIKAKDNVNVYLGTSAQGPQSAILVKNNLLILIKSQKKIEDTAWARYADSLN